MRRATLLTVVVLAFSARAHAQSKAPKDSELMTDAARSKAEEGLALFEQKRWREAYEAFRVAEDLFHAPTLLLRMGHCQRELGQLLAARDSYRRVAEEALAADAADAYRAAQTEARHELEALAKRIPRVSIVVEGRSAKEAIVTLDGKVVETDPAAIDVDPGEHRIEARAPGAEVAEKRFTAAEGMRKRITIALAPVRSKTVVVTKSVGPRVGLAPGIALASVGVAGLAIGAATGAVVLAKVRSLEEKCGGFVCPRSLQDEKNGATGLATASTVSFAIAGASLATATVLFSIHFASGDRRDETPKIAAELGPARVGLVVPW